VVKNVILIEQYSHTLFFFQNRAILSLSPIQDQVYYLYKCYTNIFFIIINDFLAYYIIVYY